METRFCKFCGEKISADAVICIKCGRQVEDLKNAKTEQPNIVINNANVNSSVGTGTVKNKWVALLLCIFLGVIGGHKFYEGKIGMGILYLCTGGLFGIGVLVDFFTLLFKPTEYYI